MDFLFQAYDFSCTKVKKKCKQCMLIPQYFTDNSFNKDSSQWHESYLEEFRTLAQTC